MFENNAKGWYGSYSVIGRNLVQRFALILKKDEILSGNLKKAYYGDYFTRDDTKFEEENNSKKNNKIDIFSTEYDELKEEKKNIKDRENMVKNANLCTHLLLAEKERYKFHQYHHKDEERNLRLIRKRDTKNLVSYHPKMDFIWKKTITGPKWKLLKGRDFLNTDVNINNDKKANQSEKPKGKNNINLSIKYNNFNSVPMIKQTKRGSLPISYDSRIRFDVPFIPLDNFNEKTNNNFSNNNIKNKKNEKNKKFLKTFDKIRKNNTSSNEKQKYLKTYNNNLNFDDSQKITICRKLRNNTSYTKTSGPSHIVNLKNKATSSKKKNNIKVSLDKETFNKTIDFSKTLPRTFNLFSHKKADQSIPSFSNPNYKLTEPRCISMVSYSKNIRDKIIPKKFIGIDPQLFLEPDKVLDLVNNHKKVSAPNFDIMSGRNQSEGPLPAYMINVWDRRSIETMTDKGLKMNNYSNSNFHSDNYSMFKPKKSYNKIINYIIMKNDNEKIDEELKNINEEVFGNKKLKKLIEAYAKDDKDNINNKINFDAISLKSYKRERKKYKNKNYPLNYHF